MTSRVAWLLAILSWPVFGQNGAAQVRAEIEKVRQSLKERPVAIPGFSDLGANIEGALKAASESADGGRIYLALESLVRATDMLGAARLAMEKSGAVKSGGMAVYEAEWQKANSDLAALEGSLRRKNWRGTPAALRALSETARARTAPLMEGSRGFAASNGPNEGLFYIGEARAQGEFAQFCGTVGGRTTGAAPAAGVSHLGELVALQEKTNAAFQPPKSIDLHSRFIALNSTLKTALELDAARMYAGALYQYLEAVRHYGMLDAVEPDAAAKTALTQNIAALAKKLAASKADDSIAQLFVERAASQTHSADEWRSARVILEQVVPAYFAARKPAAGTRRAPGKTIEITLVRWPYT